MAKQSASNKAYQYILNEIIAGKMKPGAPVIEQEIADALDMSRTPVREAIRRLEAEDFLVNLPYQGTLVKTVTTEDIREICNIRTMMELWALKKGFHLITDAELDQIEKRFMESFDPFDAEKYYEVDVAFHALIVNKAKSTRLVNLLQAYNNQTARFRHAMNASRNRYISAFDEHMEIIQDIRDRDYEKCAYDLERHLQMVSDRFVANLRESNFIT